MAKRPKKLLGGAFFRGGGVKTHVSRLFIDCHKKNKDIIQQNDPYILSNQPFAIGDSTHHSK